MDINKVSVGEIMKNERARKAVENEFPFLKNNPVVKLYYGASCGDILKKFGGKTDKDKIERLKKELESI